MGTEGPRTNAARRLEARGVPFRIRVYDQTRAFHDAGEAAALLGVPAETVYKTLVVVRDPPGRARPLLVMVPATRTLDLRALARAIGAKRVRMATRAEAERLTGQTAGGISALAVRDGAFDVYLDASARTLGQIHVSAGTRGLDLELRVEDLVRETGARWVEAAEAGGPPADA